MTNPDVKLDADLQSVIDRTDDWLRCAVDGRHERMEDILAADFRYTGHRRHGAAELTRQQLLDIAAGLKDAGSAKLDQRVFRVGPTIISTTVTRSEERIVGGHVDEELSSAMNDGLNGKLLIYTSGWRQEDGAWRCFDMHLTDAIEPGASDYPATPGDHDDLR